MFPSIYSQFPFTNTHTGRQMDTVSRSVSISCLNTSAVFIFTVSTNQNVFICKHRLHFKGKSTHVAKYDEYGGCSTVVMCLLGKNCFTESTVWAGALSWWRTKLFFYNSGSFFFWFSLICQNFLIIMEDSFIVILSETHFSKFRLYCLKP